MPRLGWKTVALNEAIYRDLAVLAEHLERPINWTANRAIEAILYRCLTESKDCPGKYDLDTVTAEKFDLR